MRSLQRRLCAAVATICSFFCVYSQGAPRSKDARTILARPVGHFAVEKTNMVGALLQLGQQEKLPLGIDCVDQAAFKESISINLDKTSVGSALQKILPHDRNCTWRVQDGVIDIVRTGVPATSKTLLDKIIPKFAVQHGTVQDASHMLHMTLEMQLHPGISGFAGDYPSSMNEPQLSRPVEMRGASVRQILNALVGEQGNAAWVIQVPFADLEHPRDLASSGVWRIVSYDDPEFPYLAETIRQNFHRAQAPQ